MWYWVFSACEKARFPYELEVGKEASEYASAGLLIQGEKRELRLFPMPKDVVMDYGPCKGEEQSIRRE